MRTRFISTLAMMVLPLIAGQVGAESCHYDSWEWNVRSRRAINRQRIQKSKSQLNLEERGRVPGCTVCEEDQVEVRLPGLPTFKICKIFRERFERAIVTARATFPIRTLVGYRVGKSKGAVNAQGLRTQFSNHSYGTALDINSELNGLYDNCTEFNLNCRLMRGGAYRPGVPGTLDTQSSLYRALKAESFRWGGEMRARQKDFMHFSLDGM